jgi:hypothetical protein
LTDELFGFAGYLYYLQGFFLNLHNVTELVCTNLSLIELLYYVFINLLLPLVLIIDLIALLYIYGSRMEQQ